MAEGRFSKLESRGSGEQKPLEPPVGSIAHKPAPRPAAPPPPSAPAAGEEYYPSFIEQADEALFTGRYRDALRHYSRALQAENHHVYPWIGQISALIGLKQFKEAELWSNRALEQFPEDPSLLSQRARVLALTGNVKRAIGVSDYAIGKGSTEWAWLARGEVLLEAGDGNALFCFQKATEIGGKEEWRVPMMAGMAYARRRQWSSAEEFLRKAVEANSQNFFIWYEYARVCIELSYFDRAADAVKRSLHLNPGFKEARELETRVYRRPFLARVLGVLKR